MAQAVEQWVGGTFDWVAAEGAGEELRAVVASLLGVHSDDMAFVTGAAGGASTVAAQLPDGTTGANVVVPARDFASNFLAWQLLADRGYDVRLVEDDAGALPTDAFAALVDRGTAVVATSLVQSASGYKVDVDALKTVTHDAGAWLVIDASQALGAVDIDIAGVDALFSCSHKWLCGIRGMAHLYVRSELRDSFRPLTPGWKSVVEPATAFYGPSFELASTASKLDVSSPWFDALVNLEGARIIAELGVPAIDAHNRSLVEALEGHGFAVPFDEPNRSPIVSIDVPDADRAIGRLRDEGMAASARAGKLRVSVHLYNTHEDIDRLAAALRR